MKRGGHTGTYEDIRGHTGAQRNTTGVQREINGSWSFLQFIRASHFVSGLFLIRWRYV